MTQPSALEQYMLELINRARFNPQGEATLFGLGDLNDGLDPNTISTASKQPLAFNPLLIDSARSHSQWMLDNDIFAHTGINNTTSKQRMINAGYQFTGSWLSGENIGYQGISGNFNVETFTADIHKNLFLSAGHRKNLLKADYFEIGLGNLTGEYKGLNGLMITQDFAKSGSNIFLTGVAYNDLISKDKLYTVSEGLGGIQITAVRQSDQTSYTTTSMDAGGYQMALPTGTYNVSFTGNGLTLGRSQQITIGSENIKLDLNTDNIPNLFYGGIGNDSLIGSLGRDTLIGDLGDDSLSGGEEIDLLNGGYGKDTAYGGTGNDFIQGEWGNDLLSGEAGNDTLKGNQDDDYLFGGADHDLLNGDLGNDFLYSGIGNDTAYGGDGNDFIQGEWGNDLLAGDAGNDTLKGNQDDDYLFGGADHDLLNGDSGNDFLYSGIGNDTAYGGDGNDFIQGEWGNDLLSGDAGNDTLKGNQDDDYLFGGADHDLLNGDLGNDFLYSGIGNDTAYGGDGNDFIQGEWGNDLLSGDAGNDTLKGNQNDDYLFGGDGNDKLDGGDGNDTAIGGAGSDIFVLKSGQSTIMVNDFADGIDFLGFTGSLNFNDLNIVNDATGTDAIIYDLSNNNAILANVMNVNAATLTQADFVVV